MPEAPTWDLVLKRNSIERLKREKFPYEVLNELPRLIVIQAAFLDEPVRPVRRDRGANALDRLCVRCAAKARQHLIRRLLRVLERLHDPIPVIIRPVWPSGSESPSPAQSSLSFSGEPGTQRKPMVRPR